MHKRPDLACLRPIIEAKFNELLTALRVAPLQARPGFRARQGDRSTVVTADTEPGNQLAGIDIRWTNYWFGQPLSIYSQFTGEDEAGGFPSLYLAQMGLETRGYFRNRWSYRWYAELAGTSCDFVKDDIFTCA